MAHFTEIFALFQWSGTEPALSLRCAWTLSELFITTSKNIVSPILQKRKREAQRVKWLAPGFTQLVLEQQCGPECSSGARAGSSGHSEPWKGAGLLQTPLDIGWPWKCWAQCWELGYSSGGGRGLRMEALISCCLPGVQPGGAAGLLLCLPSSTLSP